MYQTIFHEPWWLAAATGGAYDIVEASSSGRRLGWMPTFHKKKFGLTINRPPYLVHLSGPVVRDDLCPSHNSEVVSDLIAKLPRADIHYYKCQRQVGDVVPFQLAGFRSDVQFTSVLSGSAHTIWTGMKGKRRNQILRAERILKTSTIADPELFWSFFDANRDDNMYDRRTIVRLVAGSFERGCGRVDAALEGNRTVAAIWCIWDARSTYYFMTTRVQEAPHGAVSLLLWNAIKDAVDSGRAFDFDGIWGAGAADLYAGFGGVAKPCFKVSKTNSFAGRLAWWLKGVEPMR